VGKIVSISVRFYRKEWQLNYPTIIRKQEDKMNKKLLILLIVLSMLLASASMALANKPEVIPASWVLANIRNPCYGESGERLLNIEGSLMVFETNKLFHLTTIGQVTGVGELSGDPYMINGVIHYVENANGEKGLHNAVFIVPSKGVQFIFHNGQCK
jgi:hypothetical protein